MNANTFRAVQDEEKQDLAAKSLAYNLEHPQLRQMFQQELQAARDTPSKASSSVMQPGHKQHADALAGSSDVSAATSQSAGGSQTANAASDLDERLAQVTLHTSDHICDMGGQSVVVTNLTSSHYTCSKHKQRTALPLRQSAHMFSQPERNR